jgi:predicted nucleic acid-binding OB-fold protein
LNYEKKVLLNQGNRIKIKKSRRRVGYQDMHLFAKERGHLLVEILQLPHGALSPDT